MGVQDSRASPMHTIHEPNKQVFLDLTQSKELASSEMDPLIRVRKPYTISKQREKWTEEEHEKFMEAIQLHGRSWCRIQEHVGTKTTIQIRSHAQKFFSKLDSFILTSLPGVLPRCLYISAFSASTQVDREPNTGSSIEIPPPRPKRKPLHPYPRKLGHLYTIQIPDRKQLEKSPPIPSFSEQESGSPISVLSVVGSDASGSSFIKPPNGSISPSSSFAGSDQLNMPLNDPENGYCSPTSSNVRDNKILSLGLVSNTSFKLDESALESGLDSKDHASPEEGSLVEAQPTSVKLFGRTVYINSEKAHPLDDENIAAQCFKPVPSAQVCPHEEKTEQSPAYEALCGVPSRISCNGAASSIYYFLVPNDVQVVSKSEMFAPVPFLRSFVGNLLPFPSTNINVTSGQCKPQTRIEVPIQFFPQEDSSSASSSSSSSNNIIINDGNHSAVSNEGPELQHEPLCSFKLKRSENSAFSSVKKASTGRSARGFSPYTRNRDS